MANPAPSSFAERLSRYGISPEQVKCDCLDTSVNGGNFAAMTGSHVVTIKTSDLSVMKRWIGNGDHLFANGTLLAGAVPAHLSELGPDTDDTDALAEAGRRFVFGPTDAVAHLKPAIEKNLGPFELRLLVSKKVVIKAGHPLVFDGGHPATLVADQIVFDGATAQLISYVNLKVDATNVTIQS